MRTDLIKQPRMLLPRAVRAQSALSARDMIATWIASPHTTGVSGRPMKLAVCGMGVVAATLSATGAILW